MVAIVRAHTDGYNDGRVVRYHRICRELSSLSVRGVTLDMVWLCTIAPVSAKTHFCPFSEFFEAS